MKDLDLFGRNLNGDTPLVICQQLKNEASVKVMEKYIEDHDDSAKNADALLAELEAECERDAQLKQKKKDKKKHSKIAKAAQKQGLSVEEIQKLHQKQSEEESLAELRKE